MHRALATDGFASEVVWQVEGHNPLAREYRERDAVFASLRAYESSSLGTLRVARRCVTASGSVAEFWSLSSDQKTAGAFRSEQRVRRAKTPRLFWCAGAGSNRGPAD
jgi:hypothetical protein